MVLQRVLILDNISPINACSLMLIPSMHMLLHGQFTCLLMLRMFLKQYTTRKCFCSSPVVAYASIWTMHEMDKGNLQENCYSHTKCSTINAVMHELQYMIVHISCTRNMGTTISTLNILVLRNKLDKQPVVYVTFILGKAHTIIVAHYELYNDS